jgi:hypothetical protein
VCGRAENSEQGSLRIEMVVDRREGLKYDVITSLTSLPSPTNVLAITSSIPPFSPLKMPKSCTLCHTQRPVLIRCQIDATSTWHFVCPGACWKSVSGGVEDAKGLEGNFPYYRYGGMVRVESFLNEWEGDADVVVVERQESGWAGECEETEEGEGEAERGGEREGEGN